MRKPDIFLPIRAAITIYLAAGAWPMLLAGAESKPAINRWEPEIQAFEAADKTNPPPQNAILFIGSSSIRMWTDLRQDFPEYRVYGRGFGGSELSDSVTFADRIVIPYKPKMILVYAGDNDIANGKSPERILSDFEAFVGKVHATLPKTRIAYIAVKPCPARRAFLGEVRKTNRLIQEYASRHDRLSFIDVFTPMLDAKGEPRPDLFREDGLHMNRQGYALWTAAIKPALDEEKAEF